MVEHPQPSQRVLHQIPHDPIRSKQLRRRRNIFGFDGFAHHLIFFLGNIKLVEPSDNFHAAGSGIFCDCVPGFHQDGVFFHQIIRQKQFCIIIDGLKQKWHNFVIRITRRKKQKFIGFSLSVCCRDLASQQPPDALPQRGARDKGFINIAAFGFFKNLRLKVSRQR